MSSSAKTAPSLDHILLAVPYETLQNLPAFLTDSFTVQPGGTHADNLTANALISLKSGTYVELIALTPYADAHPALKKAVLGTSSRKPTGWIHWVLQPDGEGAQVGVANRRAKERAPGLAQAGVWPAAWADEGRQWYLEPKGGGRETPDGAKVEWLVNYPDPSVFAVGSVPFWCRDVSPREWRVRGDDAAVSHPSGAMGVDELRIVVAEEKYLEQYAEAYATIVGRECKKAVGGGYEIELEDPLEWQGESRKPKLTVGLPKDEGEKKRMVDEQVMIAEVIFRVDGEKMIARVEEEIDGEKIIFGFRK